MKQVDALKKQIKQPKGKANAMQAKTKTVAPGHTNQHSKTIISHNLGNR